MNLRARSPPPVASCNIVTESLDSLHGGSDEGASPNERFAKTTQILRHACVFHDKLPGGCASPADSLSGAFAPDMAKKQVTMVDSTGGGRLGGNKSRRLRVSGF